MEIEIYSENKSQLKRIRKPRRNIGQEDFEISLTVWQKSKKFPYPKHLLFSHVLNTFFQSFKNKNKIISNSLVSILISAK